MSLINPRVELDQLATINSNGGLSVALFPQIRDAIARKMMDIYGNDIDLSSASADAQYINMEALIYNNIYRTLAILGSDLTPSSATAKYLDVWAGYKGIKRRQASCSECYVYVKYTGTTSVTPESITALDRNGNTWTWLNPINSAGAKTITFSTDEIKSLNFRCDNVGAISATGTGIAQANIDWDSVNNGAIYTTLLQSNFKLHQSANAIVGKIRESDVELRNRMNKGYASYAHTVTEGIETALAGIQGVLDVFVYNNNTTTDITSVTSTLPDGQSVNANSIFIAIAGEEGCAIPAQTIGTTIYKALTPGVQTNAANGAGRKTVTTDGSFTDQQYTIQLSASSESYSYSTTMYWKASATIQPTVVFKILPTTTNNYTTLKTLLEKYTDSIKTALQSELEGYGMSGIVTVAKLQTIVNNIISSVGYCGTSSITGLEIGGTEGEYTTKYQIPLTLIRYSNPRVVVAYTYDETESEPVINGVKITFDNTPANS